MRRLVLLLTILACLAVPAALAKGSFPETIPLPNGFAPEGIAIGKGDTFYVGSIPTGAVYAGSLRTGTGSVLVPGATGHAAVGSVAAVPRWQSTNALVPPGQCAAEVDPAWTQGRLLAARGEADDRPL